MTAPASNSSVAVRGSVITYAPPIDHAIQKGSFHANGSQ